MAPTPVAIQELRDGGLEVVGDQRGPWLRTNGLNINGAAAKVMSFDRLWKKMSPGTFAKTKVG